MAFWGIELTESDEFCTPYDDYVDLYEIGEEPADITAKLWERYCKQYDGEENIPSNVIFAIAKAEWMFCAQSKYILTRVQNILQSDTDIAYYRTMGFSEEDLFGRRQALNRF